jgi:uncharacterized damage-inducible protein DinB
MNEKELEELKFPIGKFNYVETNDPEKIKNWISDIERLPSRLREAVKNLDEKQFNTPYREGGWTIKQVIHHLGDSHMNSYIRFKLALTENKPTIKPYDQTKWAELNDYKFAIVKDSIDFIEVFHKRFVVLLKSLSASDLEKVFIHPESGANITLKRNIALYAWHSNHHLAHITNLIKRKNWKS